jgi:SAM-dependent methyltransferase
VLDSRRFFEESWPKISQGFESETEAESEIDWIVGHVRPPAGARVLDVPCGFGRHSLALARRGFQVTGVDVSDTELGRARERARAAGLALTLLCQDMRDIEFLGEFDLLLNLFSSIGYFSDDEDQLLLERFWHALRSGGTLVLDTRNRDHVVRHFDPEETRRLPDGRTVRIRNRLDLTTSRMHGEWWLEDEGRLFGQLETRLYAGHELHRMLRPARWSTVELFGGLDGRAFELDSPRLVLVARK